MLGDEIIKFDHQMKAIEQYFPVVLFIINTVEGNSNFYIVG